ncbi:MAG: lipopolysaccharide biosynthesis protein RfbH [Promethearchaeota archaeon]
MPNSSEIEKIKNQIFDLVGKYYNIKFKKPEKFNPGQTKINYAGRIFDEKELISLIDSSLDFWLTEGNCTREFEKAFANFVGTAYCIVTNSGSSANLLAISALTSNKLPENKQLKPGDEIITVAAGFPTTIFPIIQNQAKPVFVDIELDSCNIDTTKLNDALSDNTKAVFLAHTLGNPFDVKSVKSFCEENNLWLIEDNCDALGSKYDNIYTGNFGDISTFSFYPAHHITMGEGGALLTNDPLLHRIIKSFREWGRDCWCPPGKDNTCKKRFGWQLGTLPSGYDHKYTFSELGYNLKITDMQAAIGLEQLKKLPDFIRARRRNHQHLLNELKSLENKILLPKPQKNSEPSWFGFLITLKGSNPIARNEIIKKLEEAKIQTRLLFAGNIIRQPVFDEIRGNKKKYRVVGELINTDKVMNDSFWIGVYPGMNNEMLNYMALQIKKLLK